MDTNVTQEEVNRAWSALIHQMQTSGPPAASVVARDLEEMVEMASCDPDYWEGEGGDVARRMDVERAMVLGYHDFRESL